MDDKLVGLIYSNWKTNLRSAIHHLTIAAVSFANVIQIARIADNEHPVAKHMNAMKENMLQFDPERYSSSLLEMSMTLCEAEEYALATLNSEEEAAHAED